MRQWDEDENPLWLFTPEEYNQLPDGIDLESINGKSYTKGKDYIDDDTRFGYLAYGIRSPKSHPLSELFLVFMLKNK